MKCYKDGGEMVPTVIDYEHRGIVVKGVKALRCPVCGEEVIDADEYGKVKRRIESMVNPSGSDARSAARGTAPPSTSPRTW